jgi:hypothetical protein
MAQFKLEEEDEEFLDIPQGAIPIFAGTSGTETWIERDKDTIVGISMKSIGVATSDGGTLQACIEIGSTAARGQDGPAALEGQLRVSQSAQVLVKAGERLAFKAYPVAGNAQVLRTVVWAADLQQNKAPAAPPPPAPQPAKPDHR